MEKMNEEIVIRSAQEGDFDNIFPLLCDLLSGSISQSSMAASQEDYKCYFSTLLANADSFFFVAESSGRVVGFLEGIAAQTIRSLHRNRIFVLETLVVQEEMRSLGIGKMLLNHFEDIVAKKDGQIIELYNSKSRVDAHRFYEKNEYLKNGFRFEKILHS
jgi:PhnO protein